MKTIKIGNIEFDGKEDLMMWYPNKYYGKKDEYVKDGWTESDGMLSKESCHIDLKMFDDEYHCLSIGKLVNITQDEFNIISYGTRILDLNETDTKDLKRVLKIIQEDMLDERCD